MGWIADYIDGAPGQKRCRAPLQREAALGSGDLASLTRNQVWHPFRSLSRILMESQVTDVLEGGLCVGKQNTATDCVYLEE